MMRQRKTKSRNNIPNKIRLSLAVILLLAVVLAACGAAEEVVEQENNAADNNTADEVAEEGEDDEPYATRTPRPTPLPSLTPYPEDRIEDWLVDLEWPETIFLGESDVIRLTLTPSESGLVIEAEFSDHETVTKEVPITRPSGYLLNAVAELQSSTFTITPSGPQSRELVTGKSESWLWTIEPEQPGKHRLSLTIKMEWIPLEAGQPEEREFGVISHAFEIQVDSYYGLTKAQAKLAVIAVAVLLGSVLILKIVQNTKTLLPPQVIREISRNPEVELEPKPDIHLTESEMTLLQTIFSQYARVVIEKEFMSGYSGARTFMTTPVKPDQRADAYSIIKISGRESIEREFHNYQAYVKNTLPPTTARIQEQPVSVKGMDLAALRYTFIGAPGNLPQSLRQVMLDDPDPEWFTQLADSYGPNWWLQRAPYTFRLSIEYDRKLPAHYVIRPTQRTGETLDGRVPMGKYQFELGDVVELKHFRITNLNPGRERISLLGELDQGGIPIKVTYLGTEKPKVFSGEVVATRESVLEQATDGLRLFGQPDPLKLLPSLLNQVIKGSRSIIHGDLNLENILVGPGEIVWLIDFAETREGHTLFDFAHLYAEVIAHLLCPKFTSPEEYLKRFTGGEHPLLNALEESASRFLFNPGEVGEFRLAAAVSCLGALKYSNLDEHARQLLYLSAASLLDTNL